MIRRVEVFVSLWGRSSEGFVLSSGRRDPALRGELAVLEARCFLEKEAIDPYRTVSVKIGTAPVTGGAFKPLDASRLAFKGQLGRWDVQRYLSPMFWLPFQEPGLLLRANLQPSTWSWPRPRRSHAA